MDDIHPQLWVGANKKFRKVPRARMEKVNQERVSQCSKYIRRWANKAQPRTKEQIAKTNQGVIDRQDERKRKIKAQGIDYEYEGHVRECWLRGACR